MKNKLLLILTLVLIVLTGTAFLITTLVGLSSLPLFRIARSSGGPAAPVVELIPAPTSDRSLSIDDVQVDVGVGSPIPVQLVVNGNLPDTCAQVEYSALKQDKTTFIITLSAVPSNAEGCAQATLP